MDNRPMWEKLAELADIDLNMPFSLMVDAWDILARKGISTPTRWEFAKALNEAVQSYRLIQDTRRNPDGTIEPDTYVEKLSL